MDSNWTIENWNNTISIRPTIFHNHNGYKVFIYSNNSCNLCKEKVPDWILFQYKLIGEYYFSDFILVIQKDGFIHYAIDKWTISKYDVIKGLYIKEIEIEIIELLKSYGHEIRTKMGNKKGN